MKKKTATPDLTAAHQSTVEPSNLLHSANAGLIVQRVAMVRDGAATTAREASRRMVEHINAKNPGTATVFAYEETFGVKGKLHWLMHLRSLDDYTAMLGVEGGG